MAINALLFLQSFASRQPATVNGAGIGGKKLLNYLFMKEYSIIARVGLPDQGNWQKKTSYVRVASIAANNSKQALSYYKMDKYDTSLGYIIHSAHILPHRLTITIPKWILTIANFFRFIKRLDFRQ